MKFKAFLFDCDGTVLDTNRLIMNAWMFAAKAIVPNAEVKVEDVTKHFGRTMEEASSLIAKEYGVEHFDMKFIHDTYWSYHNGHHEEIEGVYPTVVDALKGLKAAGAKIGIVTSGEVESCLSEFKEQGIEMYFDTIVGAEVPQSKPSAVPALVCCEKLGVDPKEAMFIGDSRHDMACGKNAGCTTVFVKWSLCDLSTFVGNEVPDMIIDDAKELLKYA